MVILYTLLLATVLSTWDCSFYFASTMKRLGSEIKILALPFRCRAASTVSSSSSSTSTSTASKRNPYRPEPVLHSPPPRKVIVKNLKFGRAAEEGVGGQATNTAIPTKAQQVLLSRDGRDGSSKGNDDNGEEIGEGGSGSSVNLQEAVPSNGRISSANFNSAAMRLFATTAASQTGSSSSNVSGSPNGSRLPIFFVTLAALLAGSGYWYTSSSTVKEEARIAKDYAVSNEVSKPL